MLTLTSSVQDISGIGPAKATALARLGVHSVRDLLFHVPRAYENRGKIRTLADGRDGLPSSFLLTVASVPHSTRIRRNMTLTKFRAYDESGSVEVVFFNQEYLKSTFTPGDVFRFTGKLTAQARVYQLSAPKYEKAGDGIVLPDFIPTYSLTEGLTPTVINKAVDIAVATALPLLEDYLPDEMRIRLGLPGLQNALRQLHRPDSAEGIRRSLRRLAFDEFLLFALGVALSKKSALALDAPRIDICDDAPFLGSLPYRLTDAQARVCKEIARDMTSGTPMNRLVVGDVGCGKTVCAAYAVYLALKSHHQAALMAPTEILARQHYEDLAPLFSALGYRTALLLGSTPAAAKRRIYEDLARADAERIDFVIGTHALLTEKTEFSSLALTVTDEQHRFGVYQRAALREKANGAHFLVMSATPIPRTLALVLYGDLDVSRIDELPKGRQRVDTYVVDESYRLRLNAFIRKQIAEGGQAYVVCPAIEPRTEEDGENLISLHELGTGASTEQSPLKTTAEVTEEMKIAFPDLRIDFLHGKMRPLEKDAVMADFANGKIDVLVSTTVIEVGINVPNACLMIVENAERFGLAQLHQLRGRVGRGTRRSYCILVSDHQGSTAGARLQTMRTTYDGFAVAEQDLRQRGPGDFIATATADTLRQSGGLTFRFASLCDDGDLLGLAAEESKRMLEGGAALPPLLLQEVERIFRHHESTLS